MCGRTYYSVNAVAAAAATMFGMDDTTAMMSGYNNNICKPNAGPGNEFLIFRRRPSISGQSSSRPTLPRRPEQTAKVNDDDDDCGGHHRLLEIVEAIWGLLPAAGFTSYPPLSSTSSYNTTNFSYSRHYKMFNARIETIYEKKSFVNLIRNKQTCVLVVGGYYEWIKKSDDDDDDDRTSSRSKEKKKQPYFVCHGDGKIQQKRCSSKPLLLAGLWSTVKTGRKQQRRQQQQHQQQHQQQQQQQRHDDDDDDDDDDDEVEEEEETITTFTIITTEAHSRYSWLHPRQPIMLWDTSIVNEWLHAPTVATVNKLRSVPIHGIIDGGMKSMWDTELVVHPVSNKMNTLSYQGNDCNVEIKLGGSSSSSNKHNIKTYFTSPQQQQLQPTVEGPIMKRAKVEVADIAMKDDANNAIVKTTSNVQVTNMEEWACSKCTYIHNGHKMSSYLVCVICGTERRDS